MRTLEEQVELLETLYQRNDEIEIELARISEHYRGKVYSRAEIESKHELFASLNNVIKEIEMLEARTWSV